jgi:ABC-type uncharacterized transport system involved in gliding motility auxiliary subunit
MCFDIYYAIFKICTGNMFYSSAYIVAALENIVLQAERSIIRFVQTDLYAAKLVFVSICFTGFFVGTCQPLHIFEFKSILFQDAQDAHILFHRSGGC